MSENDLKKEIEKLKTENEKLKLVNEFKGQIYFKVSEKGGVSAYGLGKFPITLYKEQWEKLLDKKDEILEFIVENETDLKTKGF